MQQEYITEMYNLNVKMKLISLCVNGTGHGDDNVPFENIICSE